MSELIARLAGALADRYTIERELGQGGMATVYLAEDIKHRRKVAIKVLRPDLAAALGPARFTQEIEIAARLQHPHILGVHDSGESNGFLYYVMPYVEGESLREKLSRQGELPVHEAVRLLCEIADALAHAHSRGVVHRDIKPENVMLSGRHALVMDFGVAKAVSEASGRNQLTTLGVALGTPAYMAPEQASADPHLDHRVDIYALGVVGYELLAGRPPFTGASPQQVLAAHVTQVPQPVSTHRPAISPALAAVIMKALEKRPADRWQSAEEMLAQLEPLATPSGGMTPTGTIPIAAVHGPRRMRWMLGGLAVLLAGAIVFAVTRPRTDSPLTVGTTRTITTDAGLYLDPALSPDGKLIAYAAGPVGRTHLYVRSVDGGRAVPLTDSLPGAHRWPQWSPDGKQIAFFSNAGIMTIPALGGPARRLVTNQGARSAHSAAWSPDGKRIAYASGIRIRIIDLQSNLDTLLVTLRDSTRPVPPRPVHELSWSPDGRSIAAVSGNVQFAFEPTGLANLAPAELAVVEVATSAIHFLSPGGTERTMSLSPVWLPDSRHLLFISTRDGGRDVYEVALTESLDAAGPATRLTTGLAAHSISITADGKTLSYSSYRPVTNIWSIPIPVRGDAPATTGRELTHGTDVIEEVAAARDGQSLAFVSDRNGNAHVYRMPAVGGAATQVTTGAFEEFGTSWSPNGEKLAYHSRRDGRLQIYVIGAEGDQEEHVPGLVNAQDVDWLSDSQVVISGRRVEGDTAQLYRSTRSRAGWGAPTPIPGTMRGAFPAVSHDGKWIAFYDRNRDLSLIPSASGTARVLVPGVEALTLPQSAAWSPDSRTIYYMVINEDATSAIWAAPLQGSAPRLVIRFDDPELIAARRFSTDGRVFYTRLIRHLSHLGVAQLVQR